MKMELNVVEAAAYLGLAKSTLNRWRHEGNGPPYRKLGKRVVYSRIALDEELAKNTFRGTSDYVKGSKMANRPEA